MKALSENAKMYFRKKPVGAKNWEFTLQAIFLVYCFLAEKVSLVTFAIRKAVSLRSTFFCFSFVGFVQSFSVTSVSLSSDFRCASCIRPPKQVRGLASTSCLLSAVLTSALRLDHLPEPMAFFLPFPWYGGVLREAFTSSCLMYFMYS